MFPSLRESKAPKKSRNENKSAVPAKNRVSSRRASNKKPGIPKFSRKKSGSSAEAVDMNVSSQSLGLKANASSKVRSKPKSSFKSKPVSNARPKPVSNSRPKPVTKPSASKKSF